MPSVTRCESAGDMGVTAKEHATGSMRARGQSYPDASKKTMVYRNMTTISRNQIGKLGDRELLETTKRLAAIERASTVDVIGALAEVESRKLHLGEGYSSMFDYCTRALHFSEHAAYGRIEAVKLALRFPAILELLRDGSVTLTTVGLLAPHLTDANHAELLSLAAHKSKRKVEELMARLSPRPDLRASVRKLSPARTSPAERPAAPCAISPAVASTAPESGGSASSSRPLDITRERISMALTSPSSKPATVTPLAPERYSVRVTISREAHEHLRRAQDLLRHSIPNGDPALVVERALALLVADLERRKLAIVSRPSAAHRTIAQSRHVAATVKREVWARDGGQCAFEGTKGRCRERGFLELHHVVPFADGGQTTAANLQLRCRAHNAYEAEQWFGLAAIDQTATRSHD
jgi:5-methylcytosine-specific restriction endonuclease McrA